MHRNTKPSHVVVGVLLTFTCTILLAQGTPAASRSAFKCEQNGKIVYSDEPCLGAKRIDVEPTRGLDTSSGKKQVGTDVRRERQNEQIATALKPLFNETAEQRAKRHRRFKLPPDSRAACERLDAEIPVAELREKQVAQDQVSETQSRLLELRRRFRTLKC